MTHAPVPEDQPGLRLIEGRVVHKLSNSLQMTFNDGPGEPFAVAVQGAGDGKGAKLGILFGFKNGGVGTHGLTFADGRELRIASKNRESSVFTTADGATVATVDRGDSSTASGADGRPVLVFGPDPEEPKVVEAFRLVVTRPDRTEVGRLDVIRTVAGWSLWRAVDAAYQAYIWWDRAGQPMKVPLLGVRIATTAELTPLERDILVCASVDLAIGLRPYIAAMS